MPQDGFGLRRGLSAGCVQNEARVELQGGFRIHPYTDDNPLCRRALFRPKGDDFRPLPFVGKRCEREGKLLQWQDCGQRSLRANERAREAEPGDEVVRVRGGGAGFAVIRRARASVDVVIRRVREYVMEALTLQGARPFQYVGHDGIKLRTVAFGVGLRERCQVRIDLGCGQVHAANARGEAERGDADTRSQFADMLPWASRDGSRKHHRIEARTETLRRLPDPDAAVQERVVGEFDTLCGLWTLIRV